MPITAALRDLVRAVATGHDPKPGDAAASGWARRLARLRPKLRVLAPVVAFLLWLLAMAGLAPYQVGRFETVLIAALSTAPVALLPGRSLLAWRVAAVATLVSGVNGLHEAGAPWPGNPVLILVYLAVLVVVGYRHPLGVLLWVWAFSIAMSLVFLDPSVGYGSMLLVSGVLGLGHLWGRWAQARAGLVAEQERGAMLTERARIARELHDVVAHHMSLIAVRSETAAYRLDKLPPAARAEFGEISGASREALTEMRRLLGVLRAPQEGRPPPPASPRRGLLGVLRAPQEQPLTAPQPGLAELEALVADARAAGTPVTLSVDGIITGVPDSVGLSAYRIVQEALSNVARHAPGAPTDLTLHRARSELTIRVRNAAGVDPNGRPLPPAVPGAAGATGGHGLLGMRERVAVLHGSLSAAETGDGGFEVRATLPLESQP
ncbi:sensor histidine kinase [Salinispora sp. H7-4]|uniref:sensor histidine kinase n=1 Tax=Salinispora sp. H7-4 TaxID=2748321 RepID=UPI0015D1FC75|nr:histidine kinase [Salinispora sp. H7-4]NYT96511.1 sensor histidine kinase [Salinispora sp. H7-4]